MKNILGILVCFFIVGYSYSQTPSNCTDYTTTGTTTDCSCGSGCTVPGIVPCDCTASWTGFGCAGFVTSTVVGPPVSCLVWGFVSINTDDFGTITTNTGGVLTITAVNANVVGNVVGPYTCVGSSGAVSITVCSSIPFTSVTVTNTGCSSGWVSNCASQTDCVTSGCIVPCLITNMTANIGACVAGPTTYTTTGVVEFTDQPTTGQLI